MLADKPPSGLRRPHTGPDHASTPVPRFRHGHLHHRAPPAIPATAARSRPSPPAPTLLVFLVRPRSPSHYHPSLSGVRFRARAAGGRRGRPVGLRDRVPGERGVAGAVAHRLGPPRATPGYPARGCRRARPGRAQEHPQGGEAALRAAFTRHHCRFGSKTLILSLPVVYFRSNSAVTIGTLLCSCILGVEPPRGGGGDEEERRAGLAAYCYLPHKRSQFRGIVEVEQLHSSVAKAALLAFVLVWPRIIVGLLLY